ncbi:MAG: oxidoreductase [Candidatus Blackburnbacteria bacterium]|nr:oxidoreductase [Candidatus Blackburnbacteria bacterium]
MNLVRLRETRGFLTLGASIDSFLNGITMYRLMLYYLALLCVVAFVLAAFGLLPFPLFAFLLSTLLLVVFCWLANTAFAKIFGAPTNFESAYITALILSLIITPVTTLPGVSFLFLAAVLAMASKYILAIGKKHIFNPAAVSVVLASLTIKQAASWWVGTPIMLIPVVVGGLLIIRKTKKFWLVLAFLAVSPALFSTSLKQVFLNSPLLFFTFVLLTEPLTQPPTKILQAVYGGLVGLLTFYQTPEIALVFGNVFSYLVSPKQKLILTLEEKKKIGNTVWDFVFKAPKSLEYQPGQYMEWTLAHSRTDSRGSRRYFTLSSSPTEETIRVGVKFDPQGSSFKKALYSLKLGDTIVASQLAGEFTLPKDVTKKLVFVAGGIGITPFRAMLKYLLDKKEKRSIIVFYSEKAADDFVYKDVLDRTRKELGVEVIYTITDKENVPANWKGKVGRIDAKMIKDEAPDFNRWQFYLSGPHSMAEGTRQTLLEMDIPKGQIKVDFFPGYA